MKYVYLYVDPSGKVNPNKDLLPVDALRQKDNLDGVYFRFCYEDKSNKIYVQDPSFRKTLSKGDEDAWKFFNRALEFLEKNNDARFAAREWGEPEHSGIKRRLSDYPECWVYLNEVFSEEFSCKPIDIPVYEHLAADVEFSDFVYLMPVGSKIGDKETTQPMLGLNRNHDAAKGELDVSMKAMGFGLVKYYLRHASHILKACGRDDLAEQCSKGVAQTTLFAINQNGKTRVFKSKPGMEDEAAIKGGLKEAEEMILFRFDKEVRRICVKNKLPCDFQENDKLKGMIEHIRTNIAKQYDLPRHMVTISFDDGLSSGFVSKISRIKPIWDMINTTIPEHAQQIQDFPILHLPFNHECTVCEGPEDEPDNVKTFRAARGIQLNYPFFTVGNIGRGMATRKIMDRILSFFFGNDPADPEEFMDFVKDHREEIKSDMKFLTSMGYGKSDVLDFFAGGFDLLKRAEYRKIYDQLCRPMSKTAQSIGLGLGINDWWRYELQDAINQADHSENKPKKKKKKQIEKKDLKNVTPSGPRSYEGMLRMKHDKEMNSQKGVEQLLRESQL